MRKRRGVRGRDWRKRRVCERVWLEEEKGRAWLEEEKVCERAGLGKRARGVRGWGWRREGV